MKHLSNQEIADHLEETGMFYEMTDVQFKPRAYYRAAGVISGYGDEVAEIYKEGGKKALDEIPGVGKGIAEHIEELLKTGTFPEYEKLHKKVPVKIRELTSVEGVGPKTVKLLWKSLGIKTLYQLRVAAKQGKLAKVKGLGKKTEENILESIKFLSTEGGRKIFGNILPLAERMEKELLAVKGVKHAVVTGSIRRRQETIGDIDIIVTTSKPEDVMKVFTSFKEVKDVLEHGPTKTVVRLRNNMHADVRVVPDDAFGAAVQYFTGDKAHNIKIRQIAKKKGYKLNEYGLWKGKKRVAAKTEKDVYKKLGLPYIEPEIRTDSGEIEAAQKGKLPKLIPYDSVLGDLQVQTEWTDGSASIEEMAREAKKLGMKYFAVTDHTKKLAMVGGLDEKKLAKQGKEIDRLNKKLRGFRILKGTECDILKDGTLDLNDKALEKLDVVGVSVHSHFNLSRAEQTKRVIRAMENPHVDIFMHPTGRVIGHRPPIDLDMDEVVKAAKRTGTALEVDGYPHRSDLRDAHVRMAVEAGCKFTISTDAHQPEHLGYLNLGVAIARRGWATKRHVLNTRPATELLKWLKTPKPKRR